MTRDDVLRMALEAGFPVLGPLRTDAAVRFAALVAAEASAARIATQVENEDLKARLAASGVAERRTVRKAVLAEREACAKVCDAEVARAMTNWRSDLPSNQPFWNGAEQLVSGCAADIRARGDK